MHTSWLMKALTSSLAIAVIVILGLWFLGKWMGFHVSLLGSLALTVGLTILVNIVVGAVQDRRESRRL